MKIHYALFSLSAASHFRANSLQYRVSRTPGKMSVTRYMGWRRASSGYSGGCTQADIDNNVQATIGNDDITGIGTFPATYIVTNIDNTNVDPNAQFCFGSFTFEIDVSSVSSFTHSGASCCTINLTMDDGTVKSGSYSYEAFVGDVNNNSPQFISPPMWHIMDGCSGQSYHVNPTDPEGDKVRCRWSTVAEAQSMAWTTDLQQFSLDEANCIITYHPEKDLAKTGAKPVAVQVEDFDASGKLLHSVPLSFVGVVFTPQLGKSQRFLASHPLYADIITGSDEHDDDHDHGRRRRSADLVSSQEITAVSRSVRSAEPAHCGGKPAFFGKSPSQGSTLTRFWSAGLKVETEWEASYTMNGVAHFDFTRYQFSRPTGMTCTPFDSNGAAKCTWFPTQAQAAAGDHPHCAVVYDKFGRASERRCMTLKVYPPCLPHEDRVGTQCLAKCAPGSERIPGHTPHCVDIDECARNIDNCTNLEDCNNTAGAYTCSCKAGLTRSAGQCSDIDECADGTHNCNAGQVCKNTWTSYNCITTTTTTTTTTTPTTTAVPTGPCVGFEILPISIKTTWKRAKRICRLAGGQLPNFNNSAELATFNKDRAGGNRKEWLGIRRAKNDFKTYGKTKIPFFNWNAGEPNNHGGIEKCVEILGNDKWNDQSCEDKLSISCRFEHVRYC